MLWILKNGLINNNLCFSYASFCLRDRLKHFWSHLFMCFIYMYIQRKTIRINMYAVIKTIEQQFVDLLPQLRGKHCCFCPAHWLLLLWLREASFVDFEDVAGLGQSNHRCSSEVDQSASDIALAFQAPDWSVGSCHRKCKGVFPGGGSLSASKNFPEDAGELFWVNLDLKFANKLWFFCSDY